MYISGVGEGEEIQAYTRSILHLHVRDWVI